MDRIISKKVRKALKMKSRISLLQEVVFDNIFLSESTKDDCIQFFGKIRKQYRMFARLAFRWKYKRSQIPITNDLYFNPIDIDKSYNYILYQNGVRYYFRISDLLRSIQQKLINYDSYDFEVESVAPINPYNKTELSKCELYNFYFYLLQSPMKIPLYFQYFFEEEFNLSIYKVKNETFLKKMALQNYVFTEPNKSIRLGTHIKEMLGKNPYIRKMKIHEDFPMSNLIDTFRSYAYIDYLILYGNLECTVEEYYDEILFLELKTFSEKNPQYGRKVFHCKPFHHRPFQKKKFHFPLPEVKEEREEHYYFYDKAIIPFHSKTL